MRTFRRITLFCCFAVLGTGLAIGVGYTTTTSPPDRHRPQQRSDATAQRDGPVPAARESAGAPVDSAVGPQLPRDAESPSLSRPPVQSTTLRVPWPAVPLPDGPQRADTYPALAQQFIPEMGKARLQQALDYVKQQLGPDSDAPPADAAAAVVPPEPKADDPEQLPLGTDEPIAKPPLSKTSIDEEGDGSLSIHIQDADVREVLELLGEEGNLNILAGTSVQGKVSATLRGVDVEGALDAILKSTGFVARREGKFIFVGTPADFDSMERAMDKLATRVYRPNYVTAAELEKLITPLLTETIGVMSVSTKAEVGIGADSAAAGGDNFAGPDVVLVRDYEGVLAQMDQLVNEIDVRPLQVAIEAMILSVKLEDTDKFGVDFAMLEKYATFGWGFTLPTLSDLVFDQGGMKFGYFDGSVATFVDALETIADTNVIATPRLMVVNKHKAEIQIGEKQGYVSTTVTETSATQAVEFLETGAILRLRPFISADGIVRMELHPELSDGYVDDSGKFTLPNKEVTEVTTNVMVRDGCTVIIGGLMQEQLVTTSAQVPLLGSLPLVGFVFRRKEEKIERREVLVLITPRIVYEPGTCREGDKAAGEFHRRQAVYADKMSPVGKRSVARRYFRMAQNAWDAGDRKKALRFVELSIHFDPLNRAAIDLRSDIWSGSQQGEHTLGPDAPAPDAAIGPPPGLIDGQTIPSWLLDGLEGEAAPRPEGLHPLDPGRPGSHTDIVQPGRFE